MANEIFNVAGNPTGTQKLGNAIVRSSGKGNYKVMDDRQITVDIADITDKYDDKWDSPRYYTGDAAT